MGAIAIITARGGSKRVPRKNVRPFLGQPIMCYPIAAALSSGLFEEVMVSTDDQEIAEIAQRAGATVPFMRSAKAADDHATTADVLNEVLTMYADRGQHFERFCCLYPTAPFITADRLRRAQDMLDAGDVDAVVSVAAFSVPPWWAMEKDESGLIRFHSPKYRLERSQDLPKTWYDAGQFYFFRTDRFLAKGTTITDNTIGLEIAETEVQDIDNEDDWILAEMKFAKLRDQR